MDFNEEFYMPELYDSDKEPVVKKDNNEETLKKSTDNLIEEPVTFEK